MCRILGTVLKGIQAKGSGLRGLGIQNPGLRWKEGHATHLDAKICKLQSISGNSTQTAVNQAHCLSPKEKNTLPAPASTLSSLRVYVGGSDMVSSYGFL